MSHLLIIRNSYEEEKQEDTGTNYCTDEDYEQRAKRSEHQVNKNSQQNPYAQFTIVYQLLIQKTD